MPRARLWRWLDEDGEPIPSPPPLHDDIDALRRAAYEEFLRRREERERALFQAQSRAEAERIRAEDSTVPSMIDTSWASTTTAHFAINGNQWLSYGLVGEPHTRFEGEIEERIPDRVLKDAHRITPTHSNVDCDRWEVALW